MIGIDTNVLVRYLMEDDKRQAEKVSAWIRDMRRRSETLVLNHIVLCEVVWVLESGYDFPKPSILQTLERLLETKRSTSTTKMMSGPRWSCIGRARATSRTI